MIFFLPIPHISKSATDKNLERSVVSIIYDAVLFSYVRIALKTRAMFRSFSEV